MEELDLKELISIFWNKKVHIVLIVAIFMVIGIIYTMAFVTPKYQSSTTLLLAKVSNTTGTQTQDIDTITTTEITLNSKLVSTYSELVKSKNVIRTVRANLGINADEEEIRQGVNVSSVKDTELIEITVTNKDAIYAAKIANEIAKVFTDKIKEYYNISNVYVVDEAEIETEPYNVNHIKDVAIFAFVGIVIASMYVLIINMLDTTIKSSEDIEKITGFTVLASIPIYEAIDDKNKRKRRGGRR